ncbi:hypothetical protein KJ786_03015 [Patescibacteria group bacterium]|nr:hypothetical protein [Patescibacteria group bacterium]
MNDNSDLPEQHLPKDCSGQKKIEFPKKFEPHEMGMVSPFGNRSKSIILYKDFLIKELDMGDPCDDRSVGKVTEVFCPFCNKGHIRLTKIEPIFSRGARSYGNLKHVGNIYEFDCSENCGAYFSGSFEWMKID